ncbi:MAG TPA: cyclic nucleotide-binding domain-containing protein, partial [Acetobacteraceae bacterium]|nr:cyclic nucleotide-binding domain-containing protein [Acetobacteraceae bacterium]
MSCPVASLDEVGGERLARRLGQFTRLSSADRDAIALLSRERVRRVGPREDLIREHDRPTGVKLMLSGWACRYRTIEDGRRQIMAFLVPGDICDLNVFILREMDHSLGAVNAVTFADINRATIE